MDLDHISETKHSLVYSLFRDMVKYKINYGYRGFFTQAVSDALIAFAQSIFSVSGASMKTRKRAFYILVECIQNITRHQEIPVEDITRKDGIFLIQSAKGMYNISQGNLIQDDQKEELSEKLNIVNSLGKDELNIFYKDVLKNTTLSEKGGAGLGLIEIARKSGNKIDYKFQSLNEGFSYFFMDTLISDPSKPRPEEIPGFYGIDITEKLMGILSRNNVNLVYCSQFAGESSFDVLDIVENLKLNKDQNALIRKRSFSILLELIQNIASHGIDMEDTDGKTGILMMGTEGDTNRIITGNVIHSDQEEKLREYLNYLNSLDGKAIEDLFIAKLTDNNLSKGMGLVDIKMKNGNPFIFDFMSINKHYTFFSIQVNIDKQSD